MCVDDNQSVNTLLRKGFSNIGHDSGQGGGGDADGAGKRGVFVGAALGDGA